MLLLHQSRVALRSALEQVAGIEPGDLGMAYRCVTTTLHLRRCAGRGEPACHLSSSGAFGRHVARRRSQRGTGGNRTHVEAV